MERVPDCPNNPTTAYRRAIRCVNDHLSDPWYTANHVGKTITDANYQMAFLKVMNEMDSEGLKLLSHSCSMCNPLSLVGDEGIAPSDIGDALIEDTRSRLAKMERVMADIKGRNNSIEKIKHHISTYRKIRRALEVVVPDDGTTYWYKIDPHEGIKLIIGAPNRDERPDLAPALDMDRVDSPIQEIAAPIPAAPTPPPVPVSSPGTPAAPTPVIRRAEPIPVMPRRPETPVAQIWDVDTYLKRPIQTDPQTASPGTLYGPPMTPPRRHRNNNKDDDNDRDSGYGRGKDDDDDDDDLDDVFVDHEEEMIDDTIEGSRLVYFTGLAPETTAKDLLAAVRGGPVLHVSGVKSSTEKGRVRFVWPQDAQAYVAYMNDPARHNERPTVKGRVPRVTLAADAEADANMYPIRASLMREIKHHGVTRCLWFPSMGPRFADALDKLFDKKDVWSGVEDHILDCANDNYNGDEEEDGAAPDNAELRISFRAVEYAEDLYNRVRRMFPRQEVYYVEDPCARPLEELDGY